MNRDPQLKKYLRRERKLRATYRRRMFIVFILALLLGAMLGWFANDKFTGTDNAVEPVLLELEETATPAPLPTWSDEADETEPTAEPTAEPTVEPTVEPTAEPEVEPTAEPEAEPTVEPTAEPTAEPTVEPTVEPTAEPTVEPTVEPTAEPEVTPEPVTVATEGTSVSPIAMGQAYTFNMDITAESKPVMDDSVTEYFTVPVTVTLARHMDHDYYVQNYASTYMLKGTEASCELIVEIGDCDGINEVNLQEAVIAVMYNELGDRQDGYQFTTAEIGGETNSVIPTGTGATIYKRYVHGEIEDIAFFTITYYSGLERHTVYFSLEQPETEAVETTEETVEETVEATPEPTSESYTVGSTGEGVTQLQTKLIALGYLSGKPDGQFGQWTASAVKQAQKDFGLEQTGVADAKFLEILYSK